MYWLEKDLNNMTREIMEDVNNTLHQHKVQNFEKLLED
jgi:hypothetical protein